MGLDNLFYCPDCRLVHKVGMGRPCRRATSVASATTVAQDAQQPEPCNFVAPITDDPAPPVRVPFLVAVVAVVVAFLCALALATGCATSLHGKRWTPPAVSIVLPTASPPCAEWTMREAAGYLDPGVPVTVERADVAGLGDGVILVDWRAPADYPTTLAVAHPFGDRADWGKSRGIVRGVIVMDRCQVALAAHELAHLMGLPHTATPGQMMSPVYLGSWKLSRRERRALELR